MAEKEDCEAPAKKRMADEQLYGTANTDQNATMSSKSRLALQTARRPVAGLWRPPYTRRRKARRPIIGD